MPRVKILIAEIGTTGNRERFEVSGNANDDLVRACELEHGCTDNHCDIGEATREGFGYTAAHLLIGATECPLLESVMQHYRISAVDTPQDWQAWLIHFRENARQCEGCEGWIFSDYPGNWSSCSNCGGSVDENRKPDC